MCDLCVELINYLENFAERIKVARQEDERTISKDGKGQNEENEDGSTSKGKEISKLFKRRQILLKDEFDKLNNFMNAWFQRQCICCFRDGRNYERFSLATQCLIRLVIKQLLAFKFVKSHENDDIQYKQQLRQEYIIDPFIVDCSNGEEDESENYWTFKDLEALFQLTAKVFLVNFPLYLPFKQHGLGGIVGNAGGNFVPGQKACFYSEFSDLSEQDVSLYLLKNVDTFCQLNGIGLIGECFEFTDLPINIAHSLISIVCNLKMWLNLKSNLDIFMPLRTKVLRYTCQLSDKDLRTPTIKLISEYMWTAVKDQMETTMTPSFDKEGLELAFKYFTSSTLTMRLSGITQINAQITCYNDASCTAQAATNEHHHNPHHNRAHHHHQMIVESIGRSIAGWLVEKSIISHIFGPNLHVEVMKQSHTVLSFLACENKITNEDIDVMWQAAQLKHCSKQVFDILNPLVKHLHRGPMTHLYQLLYAMEPKDHVQQSLLLAASITKHIWSTCCTYKNMLNRQHLANVMMNKAIRQRALPMQRGRMSQLETSEEEEDNSGMEDNSEMSTDGEDEISLAMRETIPPRKKFKISNENSELYPESSALHSRLLLKTDKSPRHARSLSESIEIKEELKRKEEAKYAASAMVILKKTDKDEAKALEVAERKKRKMGMTPNGERCAKVKKMQGGNKNSSPSCSSSCESLDAARLLELEENCQEIKIRQNLHMLREASSEEEEEDDDEEDEDEEEEEDEEDDEDMSSDEDEEALYRIREQHELQKQQQQQQGRIKPQPRMPSLPVATITMTGVKTMKAKTMGTQQIPIPPMLPLTDEDDDDGSISSNLTDKSEKNMADFEDEECGVCDEEMAQLEALIPHVKNEESSRHLKEEEFSPEESLRKFRRICQDDDDDQPTVSVMLARRKKGMRARNKVHSMTTTLMGEGGQVANICKRGSTLLWDLLQDDTIVKLTDNIAFEAEKILGTTICYTAEFGIRTRFVEACLENIRKNKSVVVSLRLLPKIFSSFNPIYRGNMMETNQIVLWAFENHGMMDIFFQNLSQYTKERREMLSGIVGNGANGTAVVGGGSLLHQLYPHCVQIQVRLQFLSQVFSPSMLPQTVTLSMREIDCLWKCLASDREVRDDFFNWLVRQIKSKEQHSLDSDALHEIYAKLMPSLSPQDMSITALSLLQTLCNMSRLNMFGPPGFFPSEGSGGKHGIKRDGLQTALLAQEKQSSDDAAMQHMWKIALHAYNTDVSLSAMTYINNYYMSYRLEHEPEFVRLCMEKLEHFWKELCGGKQQGGNDESNLLCIQRALLLLKTHLETFKRKYAYHLRRWMLNGEGISSHVAGSGTWLDAMGSSSGGGRGMTIPIRIHTHIAGLTEKVTMEMSTSDFVAELRAEASKLWEVANTRGKSSSSGGGGGRRRRRRRCRRGGCSSPCSASSESTDTEDSSHSSSLEGDGNGKGRRRSSDLRKFPQQQIRIITQGQEVSLEYDEKTLGELGFKDGQIVYVSLGSPTQGGRRGKKTAEAFNDNPSSMPPPKRKFIPTLLLLSPSYFETLFNLMHTLSILPVVAAGGGPAHNTKAQMLSRRVWDILTLLPTNPALLEAFRTLTFRDASQEGELPVDGGLSGLLDASSPQKFLYCLYIVETLSRPTFTRPASLNCKKEPNETFGDSAEVLAGIIPPLQWSELFIKKGGLRHLFNIFTSGELQNGSEWHQDCLAHLLKLLCLLGVVPLSCSDDTSCESGGSQEEKQPYQQHQQSMEFFIDIFGIGSWRMGEGSSKSKRKRHNKDRYCIPPLNGAMLQLMNVDKVMPRLASILKEMSNPRDATHYKTGFWGRAQVVHFAMALLMCWSNSGDGHVSESFIHLEGVGAWLCKLVLEDADPAVRKEISIALFRLCTTNSAIVPTLVSHLEQFLDKAERMRPQKFEPGNLHHPQEEGKEPYGPTCRDYYWLFGRLIDSYPDYHKDVDMVSLANRVWESINKREYVERRRNNCVEDDGLIGCLNLLTYIVKYNVIFKNSQTAALVIDEVFACLFDLPNSSNRHVPKCKSQASRSAAYDLLIELVKGCTDNYVRLHEKVLRQNKSGVSNQYPWDYWPWDDVRAECGYVGLTNLGATCYMASCMQHLYMMPEARYSILRAGYSPQGKHAQTLKQLQRMFAYLLESERKTYNPRSFCKVYTMDHQPLNTAEQKDMAEFFIDVVSKLEEMTPDLKEMVKTLFGGVISNNVVSLDCEHVSCTLEEFYTVRCQVADMRSLIESLNEVTVKDTLEGDNMYTCSQCGKKVRAEKRACFKKLPKILCFNTMRYSFNMLTMTKEKVNTHFSFPMRLDMSDYSEKTLMPQQYKEEREKEGMEGEEGYEYELIGVTVHTGTADGGHYYSFIKDRTYAYMAKMEMLQSVAGKRHQGGGDKWYFFNDAEVKPFDSSQIAMECFGGEMTSKTYDSVTDKFMDLSFEKTNSAYMLFYERISKDCQERQQQQQQQSATTSDAGEVESATGGPSREDYMGGSGEEDCKEEIVAASSLAPSGAYLHYYDVKLSPELEESIWKDNTQFLQDKNIFEHSYFQFIWQFCGQIPATLENPLEMTEMVNQLTLSFFLETFIHAKEKPTMVQWIELLTKQFNTSQRSCEWFLETMSLDNWWPVQILVKCPNQMIRVMFQRLCIHVIQRLREHHAPLFSHREEEMLSMAMFARGRLEDLDGREGDDEDEGDEEDGCGRRIGWANVPPSPTLSLEDGTGPSCVATFIRTILALLEESGKTYWKNLAEYFHLLYEFARMGEEEVQFLLAINTIYLMANFYLGQKPTDSIEMISAEDEEEEDLMALSASGCLGNIKEKNRSASLDKMIALVAHLVEKARDSPDPNALRLTFLDQQIISGGKGFAFLIQQIKDNINLNQTRNLIISLCKRNDPLASQIVSVIFSSINKMGNNADAGQPFYRILALLCETSNNNSNSKGWNEEEDGEEEEEDDDEEEEELEVETSEGGGDIGTKRKKRREVEIPCFTRLILRKIWDVANHTPYPILDWLAMQAPRNPTICKWILQQTDIWLERYLISHGHHRVRMAAAYLLVSLVPCPAFRNNFRPRYPLPVTCHRKEMASTSYARKVAYHVLNVLLSLLKKARQYADIANHSVNKLVQFLYLLLYCTPTRREKIMCGSYINDMWNILHTKLSEPAQPVNQNKQALLVFWNHILVDCPENALVMLQNKIIVNSIAFNYILASCAFPRAEPEDQEIITFNRLTLPAYFGILRHMCEQSQAFTRQLSAHQNFVWAFKNLISYPAQYPATVEELFKILRLMSNVPEGCSDVEAQAIGSFRKHAMQLFLQNLDPRSGWTTLLPITRVCLVTDDDCLFYIFNIGLHSTFQAFQILHSMHHETPACHIYGEMIEMVRLLQRCLKCLRIYVARENEENTATACVLATLTQQGENEKEDGNSVDVDADASMEEGRAGSSGEGGKSNEKPASLDEFSCTQDNSLQQAIVSQCTDWPDVMRKMALLLNSYNCAEMREIALANLREMLLLLPKLAIDILAPFLLQYHKIGTGQCNMAPDNGENTPEDALIVADVNTFGPYLPRKGSNSQTLDEISEQQTNSPQVKMMLGAKSLPSLRPGRPVMQMFIHPRQMYTGEDEDYQHCFEEYYGPYHFFIKAMCDAALQHNYLTESLMVLSATVAAECIHVRYTIFPEFWLRVHELKNVDGKYLEALCRSRAFHEYMMGVLIEDRASLTNDIIHRCVQTFIPRVSQDALGTLLTEENCKIMETLIEVLNENGGRDGTNVFQTDEEKSQVEGTLRSLNLVYDHVLASCPSELLPKLNHLLEKARRLANKAAPSLGEVEDAVVELVACSEGGEESGAGEAIEEIVIDD